MSGICAIAQQPGHAVDRELMRAMTASMAFRGPDGQETWVDNHVGLGHAWLRTDPFTPPVKQPATLDGKVWITADARIDDRQELTRQLAAAGRQVKPDADDAVMILHAYHAWDTACLDRLLGDFCFVIWDEARQRLFCARDHFGIKPLFYARLGNTLVVSNTLNTIRLHPGVSNELDDLAVADFLLFGNGQEPDGTIFADIRRLPAGHAATWTAQGEWKLWRYWQMPEDYGSLQLPKNEYVDAFMEQFEQAVGDRLRTNRVGIELSGGMDSTSVAAVAKRVLQLRQEPFRMHGFTCVFDEWIPDEERRFAGLAARHLGFQTHFIAAENYVLLQLPLGGCSPPEPIDEPQPTRAAAIHETTGSGARVWLTGWEGDALLSESVRPYLASLYAQGQYIDLAKSLWLFAWSQRNLLPKIWPSWPASSPSPPAGEDLPKWLNPDFERRLQLRERWMSKGDWPRSTHPSRPYAMTIFGAITADGRMFDNYDPNFTRAAVEYRHPMMDLRLIKFCMTLPLMPWATKKYILRQAMVPYLPKEIVRRPKTPLSASHLSAMLRRDARRYEYSHQTEQKVAKYVKMPSNWVASLLDSSCFSQQQGIRALILGQWLEQCDTEPRR